jgi:hypothetical protein
MDSRTTEAQPNRTLHEMLGRPCPKRPFRIEREILNLSAGVTTTPVPWLGSDQPGYGAGFSSFDASPIPRPGPSLARMSESFVDRYPGMPDAIAAVTAWLEGGRFDFNERQFVADRLNGSPEEAGAFVGGLLSLAGILATELGTACGDPPGDFLRVLALGFNRPIDEP